MPTNFDSLAAILTINTVFVSAMLLLAATSGWLLYAKLGTLTKVLIPYFHKESRRIAMLDMMSADVELVRHEIVEHRQAIGQLISTLYHSDNEQCSLSVNHAVEIQRFIESHPEWARYKKA